MATRRYSNTARQTFLSVGVTAVDPPNGGTINVDDTTGWPTPGAGEESVGALDFENQSKVELFSYTGKTAGTLTGVTRGIDGTTAQQHSAGAVVRHVASARDLETAAAAGTVGDLLDLQFVRKTADQTVTSSTVLQNDVALLQAIGANQVWLVRFVLFTTGSAAGDIKIEVTVPSGASGLFTGPGQEVGATSNVAQANWQATPFGTGAFSYGIQGGVNVIFIEAIVVNGATAGNLQLQWTQDTSSATGTTVKANSFMVAQRVA